MDTPAIPERRAVPRGPVVGATVSALVLAVTTLLALRGAPLGVDLSLFRWLNEPPAFLDVVLGAVNPVLRPVPLTLLAAAVIAWLMFSTPTPSGRWHLARDGLVAAAVTWVLCTALKNLVDRPRPLAALADVSTHGYPGTPNGASFPSSHTAVAVAVVTALWPRLRVGQRAVGVAVAVLVALDRAYIGAHWPVDLVGGAALGLLVACLTLLVLERPPLTAAGPSCP